MEQKVSASQAFHSKNGKYNGGCPSKSRKRNKEISIFGGGEESHKQEYGKGSGNKGQEKENNQALKRHMRKL